MKKILCPTDFSDSAHSAIAYAAKLCQVVGGELILFNVQSIVQLKTEEFLTGRALTLEAAAEQLEIQSREISRTFKISCYADVEISGTRLSDAIEQKASDFDLIIIGTNGPDDMYQFLTGSNAYRVIRKSRIPVLLVPVGCEYKVIGSIVYAFNYLRERVLPLTQLIPWLEKIKPELSVLQVMEAAYSDRMEVDLKELQVILGQKYENEVDLKFEIIRSAEPMKSIHEFMQRNTRDVLALCTYHEGFVEKIFQRSVIKGITAVSTYPVFVFHF